jgi:hypothetical protein
MENTTLIAQQRSAIAFSAARICDLLQWSMADYNFFIYQTGVTYLSAYFNQDINNIGSIETRKEFWNWWRNEWHKRNEAYRHDMDGKEDEVPLSKRIDLYKACHKVELLICEIAPPRISYPSNFSTINHPLCPQKQ